MRHPTLLVSTGRGEDELGVMVGEGGREGEEGRGTWR